MIRVPEDKAVEVLARCQMFEETGLLVHEDEVWLRVTEEQYNRMKDSYDSGKYRKMNDDESLLDLCELFAKEARKAKWQTLVFEYPTDVIRGLTFKDETKGQWDAEAFKELVDTISEKVFDEDDEKAIDEFLDDLFENWDEYVALDNAIDDLNSWMRENGFEYGKCGYEVTDVGGNYICHFNLAWPFGVYGLQRGFTKPVALRIDAAQDVLKTAEEQGFTCFTSVDEFKAYIEKNYLRR